MEIEDVKIEIENNNVDTITQDIIVPEEEVVFDENADIHDKLRKPRKELSAAPTEPPKGFIDQIQFYAGAMYVYINDAWVSSGDKYTDRGDPSAYDLLGSTDNTWRDWDVSSIVGSGCKLVKVKAYMRSVTNDHDGVSMRTKGNTNGITDYYGVARFVNNVYAEIFDIAPDADGIIQYKAPTGFSRADFVVVGYWN